MNSFGLGFRLSNVACAKIGKLGKLPHTPTLYHYFFHGYWHFGGCSTFWTWFWHWIFFLFHIFVYWRIVHLCWQFKEPEWDNGALAIWVMRTSPSSRRPHWWLMVSLESSPLDFRVAVVFMNLDKLFHVCTYIYIYTYVYHVTVIMLKGIILRP